MLISILIANDPFKFQKDSVWYGSNSYVVNGKKIKFSVSKANKMDLNELSEIKRRYDENADLITYEYFDEFKDRFIKANADRYNEITEEATREVQKYRERYSLDDM